jgi:hypothetical protein
MRSIEPILTNRLFCSRGTLKRKCTVQPPEPRTHKQQSSTMGVSVCCRFFCSRSTHGAKSFSHYRSMPWIYCFKAIRRKTASGNGGFTILSATRLRFAKQIMPTGKFYLLVPRVTKWCTWGWTTSLANDADFCAHDMAVIVFGFAFCPRQKANHLLFVKRAQRIVQYRREQFFGPSCPTTNYL